MSERTAIAPSTPTPSSTTAYRLLRRLLGIARPYWGHLAVIVLLSMLATPITLLNPLPMKIVVDNVITQTELPRYLDAFIPDVLETSWQRLLLVAVGILVLSRVLHTLQWTALWLLQAYTGERLALRLRSLLFRHVQRLSLTYHDTAGATDSTYRIQQDAAAIEHILVWALIPLVTSGFPIIGIVTVMAFLDWQLTLLAVAGAPLLVYLVRRYSPRLRDQWRDVKTLDSAAMSIVQEVMSSLRLVKAYGREEHEETRFVARSHERIRGHVGAVWTRSKFELLLTLTVAASLGGVLYIGARHVQAGLLTLGELIMVMAYVAQIFGPLEGMSRSSTGLASGLASIERVFAVLDQKPDVDDRPNARSLAKSAGHFRFENVSFSYRETASVLENVSLDVPAGSCVGIQGPTGSGKTTMLGLLLRLYDPTAGRVLLDGVDLRDYKLRDLREQFAIVLQEPTLFATTIRENIAYGRPDASIEQIELAARQANVHEAIAALPAGYETAVGDRGMTLSGGERQRVALARAFLKDSPVLLLDEPTSAVDVATEEQIVEALDRLMQGRTTFIIAHRLSTLRRCDIRVSLEKGRPLVEMPRSERSLVSAVAAGSD